MENKANELSERFLDFAASIFMQLKSIDTNQMNHHICMQLFRSSTSVGANYEEARGAESKQDFAHKMKIVLKEARESQYWLKLIIRTGIDNSSEINNLLEESRQISDIIAKSIKTLNSNLNKK